MKTIEKKNPKQWLYDLQAIAEQRMDAKYPNLERRCVYQIKDNERVVEHWQVNDGNLTQVIWLMIKPTNTLLMYDLDFWGSN